MKGFSDDVISNIVLEVIKEMIDTLKKVEEH